MAALKGKVDRLSKAGLKAELLSSIDLLEVEPALVIGEEGGAAFLPDDYQLDARRSVAYIEKENRKYATEGRYGEYYNQPVTGWLRSGDGKIEDVQTSKNSLHSKKAIVIATGCWTGSLMKDLISDLDIELDIHVKPRKGHLLVIENFNSFKLNHGLMEVGYIGHQDATLQPSNIDSRVDHHSEASSISMTATMDTLGNLVLGSSRQFVGFGTEIDEHIISQIWECAQEFFPALRELSLTDLERSREVRVGLRPFMPGGKPMIGPVPGLSNVFLAAGHEGEGLTLVGGGLNIKILGLHNVQAQIRMVLAFMLASLLPWVHSKPGFFLVLGSSNVDEGLGAWLPNKVLRIYIPIGSISKQDLRIFLRWAATHIGFSSLAEIEAAP